MIAFVLEWAPWIMRVLALLALPLGLVMGRRLAEQGVELEHWLSGWRGLAILGAFMAAMVSLMLTLRFPYILPIYVVALLEFLSWALVQALVLFLAALSWQMQPQQRQRILVSFIAVLAWVGVESARAWVNQPYPSDKLFARVARDGSILQSSGVTCVAASLANVMHGLGRPITEQEAAEVLGTRRSGTSDYQILKALNHYDLDFRLVSVSPETLKTLPKPIFISIDLFGINHSVIIDGVDDEGNLLGVDPTVGRVVYTPARMAKLLNSPRGIQVVQGRPK